MNDHVVEVRLQPDRRPPLLNAPSAGSVRHADAARADASGRDRRADQKVAVGHDDGLHDRRRRPPREIPTAPPRSTVSRWSRRRHSRAGSGRRRRCSIDVVSCSFRRGSGGSSEGCRLRGRRRRACQRRRRPRGRPRSEASSRSPTSGPSCCYRSPRCATTRARRCGRRACSVFQSPQTCRRDPC